MAVRWLVEALGEHQRKLTRDVDPILTPSVRRHYDRDGIDDDDVLHAYAGPIADPFVLGADSVMLVGPDRSGRMLEIGVTTTEEGDDVIFHAMKAQAHYLPKPPRRRKKR